MSAPCRWLGVHLKLRHGNLEPFTVEAEKHVEENRSWKYLILSLDGVISDCDV